MIELDRFETRLEARLRAHAATAVRPSDAAAIARVAIADAERRSHDGLRGWLQRAVSVVDPADRDTVPAGRPRMVTIGLIGLLVILLSISAVIAGADPFDEPVAPAEPILWSPARLGQDWPGPIRSEPFLGGPVISIWEGLLYDDPVGDVGPAAAWLDIAKMGVFSLQLAGDLPRLPFPDPTARWIAYGVVLDTNGDGVADVRIGMDNLSSGEHRAWRTDLASGDTKAKAGPPYGSVGATPDEGGTGRISLDTYFPGEEFVGSNGAMIRYSPLREEAMLRSYGWASLIEGGRVVATDFAPDVGWLERVDKPDATFIGPDWTLTSDVSGSHGPLTLEQSFALTADGRISIDGGCTRAVGNAFGERGVLRVSDLTFTRVSCSPEIAELDANFMAFLTAEDLTYRIEPSFGLLELYSGFGVLQLEAKWGSISGGSAAPGTSTH